MVLSEAQILAWLGHFMWPFLRITGLFITGPFYGSSSIPAVVKALIAAAYAAALAAWLPNLPPFPADPISAIFAGLIQIAFGAVLGLAMQIIVSIVASTGELISLSIGLGFAEMQMPGSAVSAPVVYNLMFWAGLMAYISAGGPIFLFAAIAHSFQAGIGTGGLAPWDQLTTLGETAISSAVWLAMPVLAVTLSINLTVGLTTVFAPQMNLLTIGFPLLIIVGLWVFTGSIVFLDHDFHHLMDLAMHSVTAMLPHG
ncbi:flagellar biosynthetic protein FliR [Acidocella sp.]|jgi:flagellar biosynthetic protein FliR|uniref:flagellar biosynthetic protein FliR n=1 Tax=Acidocella sp. TaxID=50710 RepID=UPI002F3E8A5D